MTYIVTNSAIEFDLENPTADMVSINDIAHALSNIKRFNGHLDVNASVALHCVIMSYLVPKELALEALLHDAHEAYIGDISTPLKYLLGPIVKQLEARYDSVIQDHFCITFTHSPVIKDADLECLAFEKLKFLPFVNTWPMLEGVPPALVPQELINYYKIKDCGLHKLLFLNRFFSITGKY